MIAPPSIVPSTTTSKRSKKAESTFLNMEALKKIVQKAAIDHGITNVDTKVLHYVSQAAETRVLKLLESMIHTSQHRTGLTSSRFLNTEKALAPDLELDVSIKNEERKILEKIEESDRAMEMDFKTDLPAFADDLSSDMTDMTKKKKKTGGSKKDLPENVKQKMINSTALLAAGGKMKSWMLSNDAGTGSSLLKTSFPVKKRESKKKEDGNVKNRDPALKGMRITQSDRVILRDALVCLENDLHLSKSSLHYKWINNLK